MKVEASPRPVCGANVTATVQDSAGFNVGVVAQPPGPERSKVNQSCTIVLLHVISVTGASPVLVSVNVTGALGPSATAW